MGFLVSRLPDVAERPGHIAVQGVEHGGEAYLFSRRVLTLHLGWRVRERAKTKQRQKDAGQEDEQTN